MDCDCDFTFCIEVDDDDEDDDDDDIQHDSFIPSGAPRERWIKNKNNCVLVLRDGEQLCYEQLNNSQLRSSDCLFRIQTYKRTTLFEEVGRIVVLYAKDDKYKVVCCDKQGELKVESRDSLLNEIGNDGDTSLFFLRSVTGIIKTYNFVPFFYRSHVLGFDHVDQDDSPIKLVVRPIKKDVVDECTLACLYEKP